MNYTRVLRGRSLRLAAVPLCTDKNRVYNRDVSHPHPARDLGPSFEPKHNFAEAYAFVTANGVELRSTTNEKITATHSVTKDGTTEIIVFNGERSRHGSVCRICWGHGIACDQSRVGHCAKPLDKIIA